MNLCTHCMNFMRVYLSSHTHTHTHTSQFFLKVHEEIQEESKKSSCWKSLDIEQRNEDEVRNEEKEGNE